MKSFSIFGIVTLCFVYIHTTEVDASGSAVESTSILTGPSELVSQTPKGNSRFSRLLHDNAAALQFSSISNLAPPIAGIPKDAKETKHKNHKKLSLSATHLGRRTLDYDESENFEENGEPLPRIITQPQPGNEYVYIRQGGIQTEEQQAAEASVTSINRQPANHRVPLTLLRKTDGKRVNISPAFADSNGNTYEGSPKDSSDTTTATINDDDAVEFTTILNSFNVKDHNLEDNYDNEKTQMIVNVVTSKPRIGTNAPKTTTSYPEKLASSQVTIQTPISSTTTESNKTAEDLNENLLVQSTRRIGSFPDFEDSPAPLQTAESSQPARVNVRPAQSGKEYEYEYIYYYYDDEDEDNSTSKKTGVKGSSKVPEGQGSTSTQSTTTTTALPLIENNETDFDDEEIEGDLVDEVQEVPSPSPSSTPAPVRSSQQPIHEKHSSSEKFTDSHTDNQLDRSRNPKQVLSTSKVVVPEVDYKIEAGDFDHQYDDEEEQTHVKAKGQPQRQPLEDDDQEDEHIEVKETPSSPKPSTSPPTDASTASDAQSMATMAKSHPDSVNSPIILKQSSFLQSVPASRLQPQSDNLVETRQTSPLTTPTTTTTELPIVETVTSAKPASPRFRGQQRIRGSINRETTSKPSTTEQTVVEEKEAKPKRTFNRDSSRRIPSRRPHVETSQVAPESPISESSKDAPARHVPGIRTRFPTRTSPIPIAASESSPTSEPTSPPPSSTSAPVVTEQVITQEPTEVKAQESYVRSKSANDLFTFTKLQQAVSSRAPARKDITGKGPAFLKPTVGVANSIEQSTDATTSSEATTLAPLFDAGHSSEVQPAVTTSPTTTTTTTTTTETALPGGKQRTRFGRPRRPLSNSGSSDTSSTTTEASASSTPRIPSRNRFSGRRKPSASTPVESTSNGETPASETPATASEAPKPRVPSRNRFSTRTRGGQSSTTEAPAAATNDEKKEGSASEPTIVSPAPTTGAGAARRKPIFQGRRRNPSLVSSSTAAPVSEDAEVAPKEETVAVISSTTTAPVVADAQPAVETERKRPGLPNIQRRRPGGPGVGGRVRGGRLGGSTSTTTEAPAPVSNNNEADQSDAEQSPTSQSEQLEQAPPSASSAVVPSPVDNANSRGSTGVIGRLRTRPNKLVTTTTTPAPEPVLKERKPSRLNGILNRRKIGGPISTTAAAPAQEESKAEVAEEDNNAQEQQDSQSQHKGVVVQVSSSVTESEETNAEHHGEDEPAPSSTTPGSILSRLKAQRERGSIFRKRTDHHGE